jgi:hypothetical protein
MKKLDGKEVRKFMFARYTRVLSPGCIPVDRKERASVLQQTDQPRYLVTVCVEAFNKDHAIDRLQNELYPQVSRRDWEFIEELDYSHDLGKLGKTHLLDPLHHDTHGRVQ